MVRSIRPDPFSGRKSTLVEENPNPPPSNQIGCGGLCVYFLSNDTYLVIALV